MSKIKIIINIALLYLSASYSFAQVIGGTLEVGTDRTIPYGQTTTITAEYSCPSWAFGHKIEWFQDNVWQYEGQSYTFTPTNDHELKVILSCMGAAFSTTEKILNITIQDPVVNLGEGGGVSPGTVVELSGNITGTPCEVFVYQWTQTAGSLVIIENSNGFVNSNSFTGASFVMPDTDDNLIFKLEVSPQSCYHSLYTYNNAITYFKVGGGDIPSNTGGGGKTWQNILKEDLDNKFNDSTLRNEIKLNLSGKDYYNTPLYLLNWEGIDGKSFVKYTIQFSKNKDFSNPMNFEAYGNELYVNKIQVHKISEFGYFRVRGEYNELHTQRSNLWKYENSNNLISQMPTTCKKCNKKTNFEDIIDYLEALIIMKDYWTKKIQCVKK